MELKSGWIMFIGVPGSGKTYFSHRFLEQELKPVLISPDQIRREQFQMKVYNPSLDGKVWEIVHQRLLELTNHDFVVIDAVNTALDYRRDLARRMRESKPKHIPLVGIWFDTALEVCIARQNGADRLFVVEEEAIRYMYKQLMGNPPQLSDGFDVLYRLRGEEVHLITKE